MNIGIIGMGHVSQRCHVPACEALPGLKLVGFSEINPTVIRCYEARYPFFKDYRQLLDQKPDAVIIATPSNTHAQLCIDALERGIQVLVEKPLAISVDDTNRIEEALITSTGRLFVGLHLRHSTQVKRLRAIIQSNELDRVLGFQSVFINHHRRRHTVSGYEKRRETGGGVLFDLAYHHVDLFQFLFNAQAIEVNCSIDSHQYEDDVCFMELITEGGYRGQSFFSSTSHNEHIVRMYFTLGTIMIDFFKSRSLYIFNRHNSPMRKLMSEAMYSLSMGTMVMNLLRHIRIEPYINQLRALEQEIGGKRTTLATFEDGVTALKVIEGAYRSNQSGQRVQIPK